VKISCPHDEYSPVQMSRGSATMMVVELCSYTRTVQNWNIKLIKMSQYFPVLPQSGLDAGYYVR
jgi:hypothetical protein